MRHRLAVLCLLLPACGLAGYLFVWQRGEDWAAVLSLRADEVLVGVAWPFAANQDGLDKGLLLAQAEINERGVGGKRIRLLMRDDGLDRETSRKLAIAFARIPRMTAAIGYYDDNFAVPASAIFEQNRLLHIVVGANNSYMTSHGFRYLIRSVLSNDKIGRKLAVMGVKRGYHNFAVVFEEGAFGEDLAYQTSSGLGPLDARVVFQSSYVPGKVEFRDTVTSIREAGAEAILFLGLEREGAQFIKTARVMGMKTPILGSFSDSPEMHAIAGAALEGVMFYDIYDLNSHTPENQAFVARYRRRFGGDPASYAAQGYDALRILARAIEATGSTNPLDLAYAIRYMDRWEGANGSYKFDASGELQDKDIYLMVYRHGRPEVLARTLAIDPAPAVIAHHSPAPY